MKLNCYIVQDLLPAYMEKLTSTETNTDIEAHLQDCTACKTKYENMATSIEKTASCIDQKPSFDYFKKIKQNYFYKIIFGYGILCTVMGSFFSAVFFNNPLFMDPLFYAPIICLTLYFILKDTFQWGIFKKKSLLFLHLSIVALSCFIMVSMDSISEFDWVNNTAFWGIPIEKIGLYSSYILIGTICIMILFCFYGLYRSMKTSGFYFSLLCHGLGSIGMLFSSYRILTLVDFSVHGNNIFVDANTLYIEGLLFTIFYCLSCNIRRKQ